MRDSEKKRKKTRSECIYIRYTSMSRISSRTDGDGIHAFEGRRCLAEEDDLKGLQGKVASLLVSTRLCIQRESLSFSTCVLTDTRGHTHV